MDAEYISEVKWMGFSDGQYVRHKRKRETNINSEGFALGNQQNGFATPRDAKTWEIWEEKISRKIKN